MTKKDRIAVVVTLIWFLLSTMFSLGEGMGLPGILLLMIPFYFYWGYRFIKNDISFLPIKDKDKERD